MIGPEVPHPEVARREANRSLQEKKQRKALTKSALAVVYQFDAQVAERIGFESERTIFEEMRKKESARDAKIKSFIQGSVFSYHANYSQYEIVYSDLMQNVKLETAYASFDVGLVRGTAHKLDATLHGSHYDRKKVTMGVNDESDAFLEMYQGDGEIKINPLKYEITKSGDLAVAEMQGVYERHGQPMSVDFDEKANKIVITCAERNFEYPLIINPEELFVEFEEELRF